MNRHDKNSFIDAGSLPELEPILDSWIKVQRKYAKNAKLMNKPDFAWWYGERTCIGFLSAAVWMSGGVTKEEWRTKKGPKKQPRNGRGDLYISHGGRQFVAEAKHMHSLAKGKPTPHLDYVKDNFNNAAADARTHYCNGCQQLAILFIEPFYRPGKEQDGMKEHIGGWLQMIKTEIPHHAMAWAIQPRATMKKDRKEWVMPGIVLLVRKV